MVLMIFVNSFFLVSVELNKRNKKLSFHLSKHAREIRFLHPLQTHLHITTINLLTPIDANMHQTTSAPKLSSP